MEKEHRPILVLYYKPACSYSQKVLNFLKEIDKAVPLKNVNDDPKAREELFLLGGKAQVPCLFIDGKPLYESEDIIGWLSEKKDLIE